ncbi:MAG: hypothetical protein WBF43_03675 [Methylocella sp.]
MTDLPRSHSYPVDNPRHPQGKARAKAAAPPFLLPNCAFGSELRHRAVIAIVYARIDSGPLIRCVPGSRAGPEVRPAFCVSGLNGGNFRNYRLRRLARISRLRHRPVADLVSLKFIAGFLIVLGESTKLRSWAATIGG